MARKFDFICRDCKRLTTFGWTDRRGRDL